MDPYTIIITVCLLLCMLMYFVTVGVPETSGTAIAAFMLIIFVTFTETFWLQHQYETRVKSIFIENKIIKYDESGKEYLADTSKVYKDIGQAFGIVRGE